MENPNTTQLFKEDEIAYIRRWDKERNDYVSIPFPKIGGRLRLAHEDNQALSIETEIVRYDDQTAVVCAVATTAKGSFKGIGMASVQRDEKIAPAILELAETRAIARALRFAGYGVEAVAWGVLAGTALELLIQVPPVWRRRWRRGAQEGPHIHFYRADGSAAEFGALPGDERPPWRLDP